MTREIGEISVGRRNPLDDSKVRRVFLFYGTFTRSGKLKGVQPQSGYETCHL